MLKYLNYNVRTEYFKEGSILDVYKSLPGKNCRECGELACMAFALKIVEEMAKIDQCKILSEHDYKEKKGKLLKLLAKARYINGQSN